MSGFILVTGVILIVYVLREIASKGRQERQSHTQSFSVAVQSQRASARDVQLDRCVDRNLDGKELEKQGRVAEAVVLYEANISEKFDGSHPYERLRHIYFYKGDYVNVRRVCRRFISVGHDPDLKQKYQQQIDGIDLFLTADADRKIGNAVPICPHCGIAFPGMPTRKKRCASCSKEIYVRKRPCDLKNVLVTLELAEALDEQWAMVRGCYTELEGNKERHLQARALLAERFGRSPSEGDVEWKLLNEDLLTSATAKDWPTYRDTRLAMAKLLSREKKTIDALLTFLEVCYLDLNGPVNLKDRRWRGVSEPIGPWTPKFGHLNSFIIEQIAATAKVAEVPQEALQKLFIEQATKAKQYLRLPVPENTGWKQLRDALLSRLSQN